LLSRGHNAGGEYQNKDRGPKTVADKARADRSNVDAETMDKDWRNAKKSNRQVETIHFANQKEGEEQIKDLPQEQRPATQ